MYKYVLMVVFSHNMEHFIGITKLKGPSVLHGKLNFPGGKIEEGESEYEAASRELAEETGVQVPAESWLQFATYGGADYLIHLMAAVSPDVLSAQTLEEEPVHVLATARQLEYSQRTPSQYSPDFNTMLTRALEALEARETA